MRALNRKLLRDLWRIKGQALAIALVIGTGVAIFVMSLGVLDSLVETRAAYYERYRFADVFATVKRAPERLAARIGRIPGVKAVATRIVRDVTLDVAGLEEPATGRLVSIPERGRLLLNDLAIRQGRTLAPGRPDEALISEAFAEAHGLGPGDRLSAIINGHKRRLMIVGVALSPEYVYSIAPGALMPDDKRFGILWMGREALEAAFDLDGAFNDVAVALLPGASAPDVIDQLDDVLEPYGGLGAYERADQVSNWFLSGEIDQLKTMTSVLPTIFLAAAAFLLHMVVSRLVATEREQIGLLKAFGYRNGAVGYHYVKLVLAMVSLGVVLGFFSGAWLGRNITELYTQFYRFPFLYYRPSPGTFAAAALVSAAAAMAGTAGAIRGAVTLPPAQAMVPPAPTMYRRGLLTRLRLTGFLDQPTLMILRHVGRWPVRAGLTATGIALAVSVLVLSSHWIDAIEHMVEVQFFRAQHQDVTVTLTEAQSRRALREIERLPGVLAAEPYRAVPVRLRLGHRERREAIRGVLAHADLDLVLDVNDTVVRVPPQGLVLSTKLAELLGAEVGDLVTVEVMEGRRPVRRVRVADVFERGRVRDLSGHPRLHGSGGAQPLDAGGPDHLGRASLDRPQSRGRALPRAQGYPRGGLGDAAVGGGGNLPRDPGGDPDFHHHLLRRLRLPARGRRGLQQQPHRAQRAGPGAGEPQGDGLHPSGGLLHPARRAGSAHLCGLAPGVFVRLRLGLADLPRF
jgi:putative ABC transport system permease protein